ncbi:hypothetical protein AV521_01475 [Streptomyces sp. IMTB 2501]|nr:hypothetical protein AV521_01475 [Streptomyces sp. IMTB 2501]
MWWNFVGRTQDDVQQACEDWMSGSGFGEVKGADQRHTVADPNRRAGVTFRSGTGRGTGPTTCSGGGSVMAPGSGSSSSYGPRLTQRA